MRRAVPILALTAMIAGVSCDAPPAVSPPPPNETTSPEPLKAPEVSVGLIHAFPDGVNTPFTVQADGDSIRVDTFVVNIGAVELHLCETASWGIPWVSEAHAHVSTSTTRLGIFYAEDLLRTPGSARFIGEISPPAGAYCRAEVVFAPADEDVVNLTPVATADLLGHTIYISGVRTKADGTSEPFVWTADATRVGVVDLSAISSKTLGLGAQQQVLIQKTVDPEWFSAGDPMVVLENVASALTLWSNKK